MNVQVPFLFKYAIDYLNNLDAATLVQASGGTLFTVLTALLLGCKYQTCRIHRLSSGPSCWNWDEWRCLILWLLVWIDSFVVVDFQSVVMMCATMRDVAWHCHARTWIDRLAVTDLLTWYYVVRCHCVWLIVLFGSIYLKAYPFEVRFLSQNVRCYPAD